jgi:PAS domain S-box-containing protein
MKKHAQSAQGDPGDLGLDGVQAVLELAPMGQMIVDLGGNILFINSMMKAVLGLVDDAIPPSNVSELTAGALAASIKELISSLNRGYVTTKEVKFNIDRSITKWVSLSISAVTELQGNGAVALITAIDTTHQNEMISNLNKANTTLKAVYDNSNRGILICAPDGRIIDINSRATSLLGYTIQDFVNHTLPDLFPIEEQENIRLQIENIDYSTTASFTSRLLHENGSTVDVELIFSPLHSEDGYFQVIVTELNAEKQLKPETQEKYDLLEKVLDISPSPIVIVDKNLKVIYYNKRMKGFLPFPVNVILTSNLEFRSSYFRKFDGTEMNVEEMPFADVERKKVPIYNRQFAFETSPGVLTYFSCNAAPILDDAGEFNGIIAVFTDISELHGSQEQLKRSMELFQGIFNAIQDAVVLYEPLSDGSDFMFKVVNPAFLRIEKVEENDIIGKKVTDVFPSMESFGLLSILQEVWKTGEPRYYPPTFYSDSRISGWRENHISKLSTGEILVVYSDVTERMQAEQALKAQEALFRGMFENSYDILALLDNRGNIRMTNKSWNDILGYSTGSISNLLDVVGSDDKPYLEGLFEESSHSGFYNLLIRFKTKYGLVVFLEATLSELDFADESLYLFSARDITTGRDAAEKIESLAQFPSENTNPVFRANDDGKIVYTNASADILLRRFGIDPSMNVDGIIKECMDRAIIWAASSQVTININEDVFALDIVPILGKGYVNFYGRDITKQHLMELELIQVNESLEQKVAERTKELAKAQESLVQQEKFAAAGKIANIISHEIRNPLGAINNALYFLHMKIPATDEKITKNLDIIQASVDHARQIVSDLLDFTRVKQPNFVSCNIPELLDDVIDKAAIPNTISVQRGFGTDFSADIDPSLLRQALLNLVTNAIQAMSEGGTLEIDTFVEDDSFRIDVRDTGVGIPDDVKPRLFDILFTTKPHGIGLGLPLVKEIVAKHSGTVSFESEVGTGTCFTIQMPLHQSMPGQHE